MAIITAQFLAAVFTNFSTVFEDAFNASQTGVPDICSEVNSETEMESYNWLGSVPQMQQWVAERKPAGAASNNFVIRNLPWEASIEVDRDTFEDDKLHLIEPRIRDLAHEAARHPRQLAYSLLAGGFTQKAWDGKNFFSDHSNGGKVWLNNNLAAVPLNSTNYGVAIAALRAAKDDRGRPLDPDLSAKNTQLIVGPQNHEAALQLLHSDFTIGPAAATGGGGAGTLAANIWKGSATAEITAYIPDHSWYVSYNGRAASRPFIFQWRKKPQFTALMDPNSSEVVFMRKKFYYGADSRYNVGYGFFAFAVGSTLA